MEKLIPVWDHIQAVFWFWCVWKCLDLVWIHTNCDAGINRIKGWIMNKKELKDYTNKELLAEISRRKELLKQFSEQDLKEELERREQLKRPMSEIMKSLRDRKPVSEIIENLEQGKTPEHWPQSVDLGENG